MAQYQTGTVSVTNGDATVTGSGTAWLATISAGDIFVRQGDVVSYTIASVTSDTSLELTANYAGSSGSGLTYGITIDFTPNKSYPLLASGAIGTDTIFNEAMLAVDENFEALGTASDKDIGTDNGDVSENINGTFTPILGTTYGVTITEGAGASYSGMYRKSNKTANVNMEIEFDDSGSTPSVGDRIQINGAPALLLQDGFRPSVGRACAYASLSSNGLAFYDVVMTANSEFWLVCTSKSGSVTYGNTISVELSYITKN